MKHVLVTGGAGFIGTNLCKSLLRKGHRVIAIDNLITATGDNIQDLASFKNFVFIKHDITRKFPKKILELRIDEIYHLACPTGVPNLVPLASEMLLTCSTGTYNVLELARLKKAKVVFTSSSEVYGDPEIFPQSEEYTGNVDSVGIRSPYEEGKRFSESLIAMFVRKYHIDAKIVRVFNTYGPYMSKSDTRVIPHFLLRAIRNEPLPLHGDGTQKRTFCFVDDLVSGLLLVMKKGKTGKVYNIGGDKEITIKELANMIIAMTGTKSTVKKLPRPAHDHAGRKPDLRKIQSLGWEQKITLTDGIRRVIKWGGL